MRREEIKLIAWIDQVAQMNVLTGDAASLLQ